MSFFLMSVETWLKENIRFMSMAVVSMAAAIRSNVFPGYQNVFRKILENCGLRQSNILFVLVGAAGHLLHHAASRDYSSTIFVGLMFWAAGAVSLCIKGERN